MKIKRFIGSTTQEAMFKLKKEFGSDAVVLHTRKIKHPGFLGFFKKNIVEVVAALEDEKEIENKENRGHYNNSKISKKREDTYSNNTSVNDSVNDELSREMRTIKKMMEGLVGTIDSSSKKELPNELSSIQEILIKNGVDKEVANEILRSIDEQVNLSNKDMQTIKEIVRINIDEYLDEPEPITFNGKQKVIFFIGPTGVGKTTTLAKIAANISLQYKHSVGLITADTYRIAAVEQLKIYAEILNLPLKVIYDLKDIYKAMSNFKEKDVILVDTAGRSHKNKVQMEELKELIQSVNNKEIYLVINATTELKTINSIMKEYEAIDDFKIIFSKIDEADNIGVILNTKYHFKNKLSYMTTGQNVPDDIEMFNRAKYSKLLIGENKDERSSCET